VKTREESVKRLKSDSATHDEQMSRPARRLDSHRNADEAPSVPRPTALRSYLTGIVFSTEFGAEVAHESTPEQISASGDMVELYNESAGTVSFSITATCDS
jgi:hypothetical protein